MRGRLALAKRSKPCARRCETLRLLCFLAACSSTTLWVTCIDAFQHGYFNRQPFNGQLKRRRHSEDTIHIGPCHRLSPLYWIGTTVPHTTTTMNPSTRHWTKVDPCRSNPKFTRFSAFASIASPSAAEEDTARTSSSLSSLSTSPTVRWDDLLQATQPLDCADSDQECLYRQLPFDEMDNTVPLTKLDDVVTPRDVLLLGASLAAVALSVVLWFVVWAGPGAWRYAVAGGWCAALSHVIPVPIDTIKTRRQIDPAYSRLNFWQTLQSIVREEGAKGLWVGLGPTAVGYALEGKREICTPCPVLAVAAVLD
jgi:Mitochondrial carrier protein